MKETYTATVTPTGIIITLERRTDAGQLTGSEPVNTIPLPSVVFGLTWLANAIESKGFKVESAWAIEAVQDGLRMSAVVSEIA